VSGAEWVKSSYSAETSCVEVAWVKAAASIDNGSCVEVGACDCGVLVRDSKNPDGPVLSFTPQEWDAFTAGVRNGEFDR
jgi:predicted secreted Zn-dependent protease